MRGSALANGGKVGSGGNVVKEVVAISKANVLLCVITLIN